MRRSISLVSWLFLLSVAPATAASVPEFADVSGHRFGERITVHSEMVRYLEALAETSPRLALLEQGVSWEGRRLLLAVVTSPANHARLDEIRAAARTLGDPRKLPAENVDDLIARQPVIAWLGGSIHGFELSGSEGLLKLLEHLTTREDEATRQVLDEVVVLLDPMLNPDGRDAFANTNHQRTGHQPNPLQEDWANRYNSWDSLRFRTGHYFFDTNRDWFAHTQLETRNRMATLREWRPQVVIDAHEMRRNVEFYFDPPMDPFSTHFPGHARRWFERFSEAYALAFDAAGFEYTTRELFNYYYPGYTTSYNSFQGSVGMLYEQGSTRGLALEIDDGSVRRLEDALEHQYIAALTAVRTAAQNRRELLREYHASLRQDVASGAKGARRYLIASEGDPLLLRELVALLLRNGIEVGRLLENAELGDVSNARGAALGRRSFAAGTFVVEAAQPRARLLRTLLEPELEMPGAFLEEARQRLDRGLDPRFYDITAWSLPLLFNLGGYSSQDGRALRLEVLEAAPALPEPPAEKAAYAYLLDGRAAASAAVVHHLRQRGLRASVTLKPTRIGGLEVPRGSGVVRVRQRGEGESGDVHAAVRELARRYGVALRAVQTGRADPEAAREGGLPALGSVESVALRPNRIAILAEAPVHGYSFGWAWYTLDRQYEIPVTVLAVAELASSPLHRFKTLVVPHLLSAGELADRLGERGADRLRGWVREGGNLVALGSAVELVLSHILKTGDEDATPSAGLSSWYEENSGENPRRFVVPGAILRAQLDLEVWLTAGYESPELPFLVNSDALYVQREAPPTASRRVAVRLPSDGRLRISGHLWPESRERLPGVVLAYEERVGGGRVILFPEDVNFRGFFRGADRLFLNAVLLGPGAP